MSDEKKINLRFRRKDFEKIYNLKKDGSLIRNRKTRVYIGILIVLGTAFSISIFYSISENKYVTASLMLFIGLMFITIVLYFIAKPILKWKQSVLDFFKTKESYKTQALILNDNCMELIEDENRTLERWSSISNIRIEADYLILNGSASFVFAKKSMTEEEFEYLKVFVAGKLK